MNELAWLVGKNGMLGREVEEILSARGMALVGTGRELDITDAAVVDAFAGKHCPTWIVNCAAYTNVDGAEDEPDAAGAVNATGPRNLARAARAAGAMLLHISTDYVFDGRKQDGYDPGDPVSPLGVYGRTKAEGEAAIAAETDAYVIIRTAWLYGRHGKNFVSTMLRLLKERGSVRVVDDQRGSPTYAKDLAAAIRAVIESPHMRETSGIYHYTNEGATTWFEFAQEIARLGTERGLVTDSVKVEAVSSAEWGAKAPRPMCSLLDLSKTRRVFGIAPPPWRESLARYLDELAS